jgi:hypothetical protein
MTSRSRLALTVLVLSASFGVVGCGEDGQGFRAGDVCPEQPIYHLVWADAGKDWVRVGPDGKRLADQSAVVAPNNCLTKLDGGH